MLLGCALAGPLGNGKTELIRDLAKAMGLLCIVTSCDEAKKMVTLYRYASEVLSKQGLRSFKSVSSMTGYLKRTSMKEDPEEIVLLRAFRHMNIPKFIYDDVNLFLTLLNDLFPNIHCPEISYKNVNLIIKEILIKPQYILVSEQLIQQDVDEYIDPIILDILSKNIQGGLTHQYVKLGYEHMGLNDRLVVTPLTDRIYLTVTQALSMFLDCAPAEPAGTGKTESIKDLAKAMDLLCVVTNCVEGMDYQSIGKNLNRLCQTDDWGCFDEFNRIEASVLSVVSTQVKSIQQALSLHVEQFFFEHNEIQLLSTVGIFVTMNPGYAGRTELPESVKTLFRPVVVV
ncbi:unnamed protein product [Rotaria sp. Silwood2]|nr:unnamed protein product [Rotaria sp. Silwood2]